MNILFVHPYFPGQFASIARHYVRSGQHRVVALHRDLRDGRESAPIPGVELVRYGTEVVADRPEQHVLYGTEQVIREAGSAAIAADGLRRSGFEPDLVYSHSGWGHGAFLQDVFPKARFVKYCEWFYNSDPASTEFLAPAKGFEQRIMTSLLNWPVLADLARADRMIAPTEWQRKQFPAAIQSDIRVCPDGIDTDLFCPDKTARFELPGGRIVTSSDRMVTYVTRGADPFRGFGQFIAALGQLQAEDPSLEAIIVGSRTAFYGPTHGSERHFETVMAEARIDPDRTHFTGTLAYEAYRRVLQISAAHVYLTVPFVLSWSALESLSTGVAFVGSDTAPVREFVTHGDNGLLVDFFDSDALAGAIRTARAGGPAIDAIRAKARQTIIERWSLDHALAIHLEMIDELMTN